ncbi:magnesium/cobalt transporter CorA [Methanoculleus sp.]|uniref:magnesium/cobalt transporter CorA n=1 Tax=Methanoculleus sp. TaxID=90427 RepID=UPI002FC811DA
MQQEKTCPQLSIRVIDYTKDRLEERECIELTEAWSWIGRETVTWIDVVGVPERDELVVLGRQAGIHPLTMEDITAPDQRPKVEEFGSYIAVMVRMLSVKHGRVASEQVSLVLGENYVITFREQPFHVFDRVRELLKNEQSTLRNTGPDYLAYTLLDAIVGIYLSILDSVDDRVKDLQGRVLASTDPLALKQIYELKEDLLTIRRAAMPAREVLGSLASRELSLVRKETIPYFRDVYDRCIQAAEVAEYTRDTLSGVMDLHTSNQNNRLAEITTILTIVASIFIPLSFITGFYGMDLMNIPLEDSPWGYLFVLLLMIGVALVMLLYFRKKEWI